MDVADVLRKPPSSHYFTRATIPNKREKGRSRIGHRRERASGKLAIAPAELHPSLVFLKIPSPGHVATCILHTLPAGLCAPDSLAKSDEVWKNGKRKTGLNKRVT